MFNVDFLLFRRFRLTGNADVPAADGLHPQLSDFLIALKCSKIHGIRVHSGKAFLRKDHLGAFFSQRIPQDPVRAVAHAGFAQGAVERDLKTVSLRVTRAKQQCGPFRPHGVGGGRSLAGFVNVTDGFHGGYLLKEFIRNGLYQIVRGNTMGKFQLTVDS